MVAWALAGQVGALGGPVLVGDYETPDAAVIVFNESWPDAWPKLVKAVASEVPVYVLREDGATTKAMTRQIEALPERTLDVLETLSFQVDTPWARDWGPLTVRSAKGVTWLDTPYAVDRPADDVAPRMLARAFGASVVDVDPPIDGGAIASNGRGLCVMTREYIEKHIEGQEIDPASVGCRSVTYVPALEQESTKHVDMFLQFIGPDAIVLAEVDPLADPENATRLEATYDAVVDAAVAQGLELKVTRVPMGPADREGNYFPYINFARFGDTLIVPSYHSVSVRMQARAYARLQTAMPNLRQVAIHADDMATSGGSVHCITVGLWLTVNPRRGWPVD